MMKRIAVLLFFSAPASAQPTAAVVGWKFDHAPGITTHAGVITGWPASLGPVPTEDQISVWRVEYNLAMEEQSAEEAIDLDPRETARALEDLVAVLIEERAISRAKIPPLIIERVNRRRARRGRAPL